MQWYRFQLTKEQVMAGQISSVIKDFIRELIKVGGPRDMGLFSLPRSGQEPLHLYILDGSEGQAKGFIERYAATPCEKPSNTDDLNVLGGDQKVSDLL